MEIIKEGDYFIQQNYYWYGVTYFGSYKNMRYMIKREPSANLFYNSDERKNPDAKRIPVVTHIDDSIREMAGGSGSNRGTGGMATKITAAAAATSAGINCCVMSGSDPSKLYKLMNGEQLGTMFVAAEGTL